MNRALDIIDNWQMALELKALCYLLSTSEDSYLDTVKHMLPSTRPVFNQLWRAYSSQSFEDELEIKEFEYYMAVPVYLKIYGGKLEESFELLEQGVKQRSGQFLGFRFDPLLAPLREFSAFKKLEAPYVSSTLSVADKDAPKTKTAEVLTEKEVLNYSDQLESLMHIEKVYGDPQLTLRSTAEKLDLHPNRLSWLVNKKVGKGFNEYVNQFRLIDFQERVLKPENQHLTLLGMAYDSGFNSKSVFNEFFKKQTGMTPKAWVKANS